MCHVAYYLEKFMYEWDFEIKYDMRQINEFQTKKKKKWIIPVIEWLWM